MAPLYIPLVALFTALLLCVFPTIIQMNSLSSIQRTLKKQLFLLVILLAIVACSSDSPKPAFATDPVYKDLPAISDKGLDVFGAYFNDTTFLSDSRNTPVKIIVNETGAVWLVFTGHKGANSNDTFTMKLFLDNYEAQDYKSLTNLDGITIEFTHLQVEPTYELVLADKTSSMFTFVRSANFQFHAKYDDAKKKVILSGTFDVIGSRQPGDFAITHGRFDTGVNDTNFIRQ